VLSSVGLRTGCSAATTDRPFDCEASVRSAGEVYWLARERSLAKRDLALANMRAKEQRGTLKCERRAGAQQEIREAFASDMDRAWRAYLKASKRYVVRPPPAESKPASSAPAARVIDEAKASLHNISRRASRALSASR